MFVQLPFRGLPFSFSLTLFTYLTGVTTTITKIHEKDAGLNQVNNCDADKDERQRHVLVDKCRALKSFTAGIWMSQPSHSQDERGGQGRGRT